jgi:hypothetical protein
VEEQVEEPASPAEDPISSAVVHSPLATSLRQALGGELPSATTAGATVGVLVATLLALARASQVRKRHDHPDQQDEALAQMAEDRWECDWRMLVVQFDAHCSRRFRSFSAGRLLSVEQCGQLAICDAHARYNDFGLIALPLLYIFPG